MHGPTLTAAGVTVGQPLHSMKKVLGTVASAGQPRTQDASTSTLLPQAIP